ncbi:1835_t:CDS:2 [Gigaspora margarita]|uniref:1835_t:CDS:1 n=1 Tax=Gigaspora margarita TaxID=4874 RepID=A0ABN7UHD0_GIGMA|nr:1835_t:CDS:2 [Gigaspora margarita]
MGQFAGYIHARSLPHIDAWTEFQPEQITTFYRRPSPTFSEPSKPKNAWTMPIPNKQSFHSVLCMLRHLLYIVDDVFPLNVGWALKENMKLGKKAGNLRAEDRYSPENMHASLEELAVIGELTFEEIPTIKTIKGWIGRYSANLKKRSVGKSTVRE